MRFKEFIREVGEARQQAKAGLRKNRLRLECQVALESAEQKLAGLESVEVVKTNGVGKHRGKNYTHININRPVIIDGVEYAKAWTGPVEKKSGAVAIFKANDITKRFLMQNVLDDIIELAQKDPEAVQAVIKIHQTLRWDIKNVMQNTRESQVFACLLELLLYNQGVINQTRYDRACRDAKVHIVAIATGVDDLNLLTKHNLRPFEKTA